MADLDLLDMLLQHQNFPGRRHQPLQVPQIQWGPRREEVYRRNRHQEPGSTFVTPKLVVPRRGLAREFAFLSLCTYHSSDYRFGLGLDLGYGFGLVLGYGFGLGPG